MPRPPGLVTVAVLRAIRQGRRYGADIMDATELGGGTVYKVLSRLERRGWIEGAWEDAGVAEEARRPRRRYYRLRPEGERAVGEAMERIARLAGERFDPAPDRT